MVRKSNGMRGRCCYWYHNKLHPYTSIFYQLLGGRIRIYILRLRQTICHSIVKTLLADSTVAPGLAAVFRYGYGVNVLPSCVSSCMSLG